MDEAVNYLDRIQRARETALNVASARTFTSFPGGNVDHTAKMLELAERLEAWILR
jgi:hypothetical protein